MKNQSNRIVLKALDPFEKVQIVLNGSRGVHPPSYVILELVKSLFGYYPADYGSEPVYFGVTDHDFFIISMKPFGKPGEVRRIPLRHISRISTRQRLLYDEVYLETDMGENLIFGVSRSMRTDTQNLVQILGVENVASDAHGQTLEGGITPQADTAASPPKPIQHPYLVAFLTSTAGGIVGTLIATVLSILLFSFLGETINGSPLPDDYAEGMGYLLGFFCIVMIPVGSLILGGIPGLIWAIIRHYPRHPMNLFQLFLVGFFTVFVLTLGGMVWMIRIF